MTNIIINDVKYCNSEQYLFRDLNIEFPCNIKIGLVGSNGSGKTTLLKSLIKSNIKYYPILELPTGDNVVDFIKKEVPYIEEWQIDLEFNKLNLDLNIKSRGLNKISYGEFRKVQLVTVFLGNYDFLLLDEVTTHLQLNLKKDILNYLKRKNGYIVVSHDINFLDQLINKLLVITNFNIEIYNCNYSTYQEILESKKLAQRAERNKLEKEIKRLEKSAKDKNKWSTRKEASKYGVLKNGEKVADKGFTGSRAARMMKTAKNIDKRVEKNINDKKNILKDFTEVKNLKVEHEYSSNKPVFDNIEYKNIIINMKLRDILVAKGDNGVGKTTLLNKLYNIQNKYSCSIVSQEKEEVVGSYQEYIARYQIDESKFKTLLIYLGFNRKDLSKSLDNLSSGQKRKVMISRSLCEDKDILFWDEPFNYLDINSKIQIIELIKTSNLTMIIVSHDEIFDTCACTELIVNN